MSKFGVSGKFILWCTLLVVFFLSVVLINKYCFPQITLKGGNVITVNYTYVTPTTKNGGVNNTFNNLKRIMETGRPTGKPH